MRPIPATRLGHAHGLLRAIDKRGRLRTDEFVTEFSLEELFPPDLENALGRMRHFISYGRAAGLVKEDRGVVELTEIGRRYVRAGDASSPFDISPQQAEWLRRQLREKHMTDSIFHGLAIGLSLLASCPPGSRVSTIDFGRSMAYLGRAGWDNENTLEIQGERHLLLLQDMELLDGEHQLTATGNQVRGELTLPVHMSLIDIAGQLNPGGPDAVRADADKEFSQTPVAVEPAAAPEEENDYHDVGPGDWVPSDDAPIVPRADRPPGELTSGDPLASTPSSTPPPSGAPVEASQPSSGPPPAVTPDPAGAAASGPPAAGEPSGQPPAPVAGAPDLPPPVVPEGVASAPPPAVAPPVEGVASAPPPAVAAPVEGVASAPPPAVAAPVEGPPPVAPAGAAPHGAASAPPPFVDAPVAAPPPQVSAGAPPAAPPHVASAPPRQADPAFVEAWAIRAAAEAAGLRLPPGVYANVAAALSAGKHLILTGAPGAGKTTLALAVTRAAAQSGRAHGATVVTAEPSRDLLVDAATRGRWLIVDELNHADPDAALGALSTFLAGVPVTLNATEEATPADGWRIVATWNGAAPKAAVLRRFAVIDVTAPPQDEVRALLHQAAGGDPVASRAAGRLLALADLVPVGVGVYLDAARHAAARNAAVAADEATLAREAFAAYVAPLPGDLDERRVNELLGGP